MNTTPDDTTLTLWLDDELHGEDLARVEAWAAQHPDQLAAREEIRRWRRMISNSVPASEEPPAPEFFNERILHSIRDHTATTTDHSNKVTSWGRFWMPLSACAGMAFAFWLGMKAVPGASDISSQHQAPSSQNHVYAPDQGVEAQYFTSHGAAASIIILQGVNAIPDDIDFTVNTANGTWREIDSTAVIESSDTTNP